MSGSVHSWQPGEPDPATPGSAGAVMSVHLITAAVDTSAEDALRLMAHHDVHHLLLEDRGRIVAIVSDRDLWASGGYASREDGRRAQRPVFQRAHYHLVCIGQDAPLEEAARLMLTDAVSSLPVVNQAGEIAGILTSRDLLRHLAFGRPRFVVPAAS